MGTSGNGTQPFCEVSSRSFCDQPSVHRTRLRRAPTEAVSSQKTDFAFAVRFASIPPGTWLHQPNLSLAKFRARRNSFCLPSPPNPTNAFAQNSPQPQQALPKPETPKAIATANPPHQTFSPVGIPPPQNPPKVSPKPRPRETTFAHSPNLKTALALQKPNSASLLHSVHFALAQPNPATFVKVLRR